MTTGDEGVAAKNLQEVGMEKSFEERVRENRGLFRLDIERQKIFRKSCKFQKVHFPYMNIKKCFYKMWFLPNIL